MGLIHLHKMMIEDMKPEIERLSEKLNYTLQFNIETGATDVFNETMLPVAHIYGTLDLLTFLKNVDQSQNNN
jgi:hypothetical protein